MVIFSTTQNQKPQVSFLKMDINFDYFQKFVTQKTPVKLKLNSSVNGRTLANVSEL